MPLLFKSKDTLDISMIGSELISEFTGMAKFFAEYFSGDDWEDDFIMYSLHNSLNNEESEAPLGLSFPEAMCFTTLLKQRYQEFKKDNPDQEIPFSPELFDTLDEELSRIYYSFLPLDDDEAFIWKDDFEDLMLLDEDELINALCNVEALLQEHDNDPDYIDAILIGFICSGTNKAYELGKRVNKFELYANYQAQQEAEIKYLESVEAPNNPLHYH